MTTRQRPGDAGDADARRIALDIGREIRLAREQLGMSQLRAARAAGMSDSQLSRLERSELDAPSLEQLCRSARAVGLVLSVRAYPTGPRVNDRGQLPLLARLEAMLAPPLRVTREVPLPAPGDLRAWDARITDGTAVASLDAEARLADIQAVARRVAAKQRDDPGAGPVLLVLNRTTHNRAILTQHREALRAQLPLDGAAIARALRAGRVPPAGGIIML